MLDDMFWSILANLLYNGMTWATAKAYMLQYYVLSDSASQTAAAAAMEANKTAGANIVAQGAIAPGSRTQTAAPWYVQGAPFEASLPNTAGILPSISGAAGDILGTDGVTLAWGAGGGAAFISSIAAPAAASANGLSVTAGALSSTPADATHPGHVVPGTQDLGDHKTVGGVLLDSNAGGGIGDAGVGLNADVTGMYYSGGNMILYAAQDSFVFKAGASFLTQMIIDRPGKSLDLTGLGTGASIQLKSPDGTVYTLHIANGGTLVIA